MPRPGASPASWSNDAYSSKPSDGSGCTMARACRAHVVCVGEGLVTVTHDPIRSHDGAVAGSARRRACVQSPGTLPRLVRCRAAIDRRAVMRVWSIPILGSVALSLAAPSMADAHPRLDPAMLLGSMAAPLGMFAGSRHSVRYYRRGRLSDLPQGQERPLLGLRLPHDRGRGVCWFARR